MVVEVLAVLIFLAYSFRRAARTGVIVFMHAFAILVTFVAMAVRHHRFQVVQALARPLTIRSRSRQYTHLRDERRMLLAAASQALLLVLHYPLPRYLSAWSAHLNLFKLCNHSSSPRIIETLAIFSWIMFAFSASHDHFDKL